MSPIFVAAALAASLTDFELSATASDMLDDEPEQAADTKPARMTTHIRFERRGSIVATVMTTVVSPLFPWRCKRCGVSS